MSTTQEEATFAAGCFWGVEDAFRKLPGVIDAESGYTGGHVDNPTYEQVCEGDTGHAEAVHVTYDPSIVSYTELLTLFWKLHDPTTPNQQGPNIGEQYRSAIFYHTPKQHDLAEESKAELEVSGKYEDPIITEITPSSVFYRAEEYHQRFVEKNGYGACHI